MKTHTDRKEIALEKYLEEKTLAGQMEAITALHNLVVVSAGAGTGKTWTLAWRFAWAIATGRSSVKEILTLTFTENAASEMKERIYSILEMLESDFPSMKPVFSSAKEQLHEAYISTIHSFAMRVIRESSLQLPLDPEASTVAQADEETFWRDIEEKLDTLDGGWFSSGLGEKWKEAASSFFAADGAMTLVNSYGARMITTFARGAAALFYPMGKSPEDLLQWGRSLEEKDEELQAALGKSLEPEMQGHWELWLANGGIIDSLNLMAIKGKKPVLAQKLETLKREFGDSCPVPDNLPLFIESLTEAISGARGKLADRIQTILGEKTKDYRNRLLELSPVFTFIHRGFCEAETQTRADLLLFAAISWQTWQEKKAAKGLISFDDMIFMAGEALKKNVGYADRFREILIDEFQDTNKLQDELVNQVFIHDHQRLFIVGDLKQSIYGFRHANPSLFLDYISRATGENDGIYINLDTSFRSRDCIIDRINKLFSSTWKAGLGRNLRHGYEELKPPVTLDWYRERQDTALPDLSIILESPETGEKEKIGSFREKAARKLGLRLMELKNSGMTVWDKRDLLQRPLSWRDMAILVPTRAQYGPLDRVLRNELGLPVYLTGSTEYYSRSEIRDLVALLQFLHDRKDSLSLLHFLSSPFSGLTLKEVNSILHSTGKTSDSTENILSEAARYRPEISSFLDYLARKAVIKGPSSVIEEIAADQEALKRYPPWFRKSAAANIRKAVDIIREYEASLGKDLPGCAEYLEKSAKRGIKLEEAPVTGEDEDVIRVMTVHSAKGLEFPLVAVFGLEQPSKSYGHGTSLYACTKTGAALSSLPDNPDSPGDEEPLSNCIFRYFREEELYEEWQRLFYVAATRARDSLFFCGSLEKNGEDLKIKERSWIKILADYAGGIENLPLNRGESSVPCKDKEDKIEETGTTFQEHVPLPDQAGIRLEKISATGFSLYCFCPYAFRMKFLQGMDLNWELPGEDGPGGSDLGTLAHWILQRWDFRPGSLEKMMPEDEGEILARKKDLPFYLHPVWSDKRSRENLKAWLSNLAGKPLGGKLALLCEKNAVEREYPFSVEVADVTRMVGSIDILWRETDTIHVRDYKITAVENSPPELYSMQMKFYSLALSMLEPDMKQEIRLYHLREAMETAPIPADRESIEETRLRLLDMTSKAAAGELPPEPGKCKRCPFRKSCTNPCSK